MAPSGMEATIFQPVVQCPQLCMYEDHAKCEPCAIKSHCNSSNREMHITGPFLVRQLTSSMYCVSVWPLCFVCRGVRGYGPLNYRMWPGDVSMNVCHYGQKAPWMVM